MEKVLIITYYWPPSGGPGVQRWLKFVKYLPEFGIEPIVLTVDPKKASYPLSDRSLVKEVPKNTLVFHTDTSEPYTLYKKILGKKEVPYSGFANESNPSFFSKVSRFIRGNLFVPDARVGWNKFAIQKATELIEKHKIQTVITTSPPHSTQLVGLQLKKKFPYIRWIADLRDPWTDIFYYDKMMHLPYAKKKDLGFEKEVLAKADVVLTVGKSLKEVFAAKMNSKLANKIEVISNGYDESDLHGISSKKNTEVYTITYTGTIANDYNISGFISAIKTVKLSKKIQLNFIGKIDESWKKKLQESFSENIHFVEHVSHEQAVQYMFDADLLLLVIPQIKLNNGIVTGKIFEYMASGNTVIGLGPTDGDAADILSKTQSGKMFLYDDENGIRSFVESALSSPKSQHNKGALELMFSRRNLTKQLSEIIEHKSE